MPECYYCGNDKNLHKRKVFDNEMQCTIEVDLCEECINYLDDFGERNPNQEFN